MVPFRGEDTDTVGFGLSSVFPCPDPDGVNAASA